MSKKVINQLDVLQEDWVKTEDVSKKTGICRLTLYKAMICKNIKYKYDPDDRRIKWLFVPDLKRELGERFSKIVEVPDEIPQEVVPETDTETVKLDCDFCPFASGDSAKKVCNNSCKSGLAKLYNNIMGGYKKQEESEGTK